MLREILLGVGFLSISCGIGFAQDVTVEMEGRYWSSSLDAEAKVVESNIGSDFGFTSDLGIKDEDFPEGRIVWHTGPNSKLRLAYTQVEYSGDRDVTRTIQFKGASYTAGTRVVSELDIKYLRLGWIWQFINIADEKVKLGTIVEAKGVTADISLDAPNLSPAISESEYFLGALPTLGVSLDVNPMGKVNIFTEISGVHAGDYGYFFDAELGVKIMLVKNFTVTGGFRIIDIKAKDDPDFVEMEISGPFIGATVRF